jgi:hypothetical protein
MFPETPLAALAQTGCSSGRVIDKTGQPVKGIRIAESTSEK